MSASGTDVETHPAKDCGSPEDRCQNTKRAAEEAGYDDGEKEARVGGEEEGGSAGESEHGERLNQTAAARAR